MCETRSLIPSIKSYSSYRSTKYFTNNANNALFITLLQINRAIRIIKVK